MAICGGKGIWQEIYGLLLYHLCLIVVNTLVILADRNDMFNFLPVTDF